MISEWMLNAKYGNTRRAHPAKGGQEVLMVITSLVLNSTWRINGYTPDTLDIDYIRRLLPTIYHNDLDCYFWAFDIKLPSGRWLENIRFEDALTTINAYIETPEEA